MAPSIFVRQVALDVVSRSIGYGLEYEIRHLIVIAEAARNRWESSFITGAAGHKQDLKVDGAYIEARYKLALGLFPAGRWSTLRFGRIDDGLGSGRRVRWDRSADRLDLSVGYRITDGVLAKGGFQLNDLHAASAYDESDHLVGLSLTVGF